MEREWTIDLIIRECGGPAKVADTLDLTESAVAKMRRNGIQDRHWSSLINLGGGVFDARDIFAANEAARRLGVGHSRGDHSGATNGQGLHNSAVL